MHTVSLFNDFILKQIASGYELGEGIPTVLFNTVQRRIVAILILVHGKTFKDGFPLVCRYVFGTNIFYITY